jgi:hypothetical protein
MNQIVPNKKQPGAVRGKPQDIRQRARARGFTPRQDEVRNLKSKVQSLGSRTRRGESPDCRSDEPRSAAADYLASLLCVWFALALLATGCTSPRPLKGGKAVTTHNRAGAIEHTLLQGENPSQPTRQTEETLKIRTYTLPAGSRIEDSLSTLPPSPYGYGGRVHPSPSALVLRETGQPSTSYTLSAPMPVVEREEARTRTELGAAQKDTARELGARLASLKGIVWVGVLACSCSAWRRWSGRHSRQSLPA